MQLGLFYARTISEEEAQKEYFIVVKDRLAFFPVPGTYFDLCHGSSLRQAKVESYHCECRGHDKPHEHYFIRYRGLKAGDRIIVQRDPRQPSHYVVTVQSAVAQHEFCG